MSRDSRERRNGRRRLFVYRPSPDSWTSLTVQSQGLSPLKGDLGREQEGPGEWQPPSPRACDGLEGRFRGGATAAQLERACLSSPSKERALPSPADRIPPVEHQVPPYVMPPADGQLPAGEGDDGAVGGAPAEVRPGCPPAEGPRWGLVPLFHSVRSKLESFADIFLSPIKSRRDSQHALHSEPVAAQTQQYGDPPEDSPAEHPADCAPSTPPREGAAPRMNLQLKIEIRSPSSTLCRPPLQRCLSCPLLPHPARRRSLETGVCSCRAPPPRRRRRRHSVGTVEEYRKLPLSPVALSCLRKEKHPSALWPPRADSSLPSGLDEERVSDSVVSAGEEHLAQQSPARCQAVTSRRVSTIQIRKRVTRQEGGLTPLGLPKRIRLQKDDFSLEEIYTNKNYHTPTEKRKFETIFEEPVMKGGALILTGQRPLRRMMVFKDGGAPRRRRRRGRGGGRTHSGLTSGVGEVNVELLLRHKLDQLEAALQHDEEAGLHSTVVL